MRPLSRSRKARYTVSAIYSPRTWESAAEMRDTTMWMSIMLSGTIGGLIGGMIGFRQNKKVINELGEMIYHIEEMSDLDDKNDNAEK